MPYVERDPETGTVKGIYANPQPGYAEEAAAGDEPEVAAFRAHIEALLASPAAPVTISPREFWTLVGEARRAQLYAAKRTDPVLEILVDDLNAGPIEPAHPRTAAGLGYCVQAGYCTAEERDRLLAGRPLAAPGT